MWALLYSFVFSNTLSVTLVSLNPHKSPNPLLLPTATLSIPKYVRTLWMQKQASCTALLSLLLLASLPWDISVIKGNTDSPLFFYSFSLNNSIGPSRRGCWMNPISSSSHANHHTVSCNHPPGAECTNTAVRQRHLNGSSTMVSGWFSWHHLYPEKMVKTV